MTIIKVLAPRLIFGMPLQQLTMDSLERGGVPVSVTFDSDADPVTGGTGSVYPVVTPHGLVLKRIPVYPSAAIGALPRYTAHITATRARAASRLQGSRSWRYTPPDEGEILRRLVEDVLSTHYNIEWEPGSSLRFHTIWLLQKLAPGASLRTIFNATRGGAPEEAVRLSIARQVVRFAATLSGLGLIHLDFEPTNIFWDERSDTVTPIDLDGSGLLGRSAGTSPGWDFEPLTVGKPTLRRPPWFPPQNLRADPLTGNYSAAEVWTVLDTVIRILTWNQQDVLGWLRPDVVRALSGPFREMDQRLSDGQAGGPEDILDDWRRAWRSHVAALIPRFQEYREQLHPGVSSASQDRWVKSGFPSCLAYFATLAEDAALKPSVLIGGRGGATAIYVQMHDNLYPTG